jgi:hypothetical protein
MGEIPTEESEGNKADGDESFAYFVAFCFEENRGPVGAAPVAAALWAAPSSRATMAMP